MVKAVTHQEVSFDQLGGAAIHREQSGVAHFTAPDEEALLANVRWLLSYLPCNNLTPPPYLPSTDDPLRKLSRTRPNCPCRSATTLRRAQRDGCVMTRNSWKSKASKALEHAGKVFKRA